MVLIVLLCNHSYEVAAENSTFLHVLYELASMNLAALSDLKVALLAEGFELHQVLGYHEFGLHEFH